MLVGVTPDHQFPLAVSRIVEIDRHQLLHDGKPPRPSRPAARGGFRVNDQDRNEKPRRARAEDLRADLSAQASQPNSATVTARGSSWGGVAPRYRRQAEALCEP